MDVIFSGTKRKNHSRVYNKQTTNFFIINKSSLTELTITDYSLSLSLSYRRGRGIYTNSSPRYGGTDYGQKGILVPS